MIYYPLDIVIHLLNNWGLDYLSLQSCPVDYIPVAVPDPALEIREEGGGQSPWAWAPLAPPWICHCVACVAEEAQGLG